MKLSFHGAAKIVTGSCHLLDTGKTKILFDCGVFQGDKETDKLNYEPFAFDPASIQYVFLSHAHLDHCGRLPRLVRHGFNGKIICTGPTRDLAKVILLDAAKLQREDKGRNYENMKLEENGEAIEPLYTDEDVLKAIGLMEIYNYGDSVKLSDDLEFRFRDAGHILGSAITEIWVKNGFGRERKVVFSGDLGHHGQRIVKDPDLLSEADYVIVESTYGTRVHKSRDETVLELLGILRDAEAHQGNVLIPTFAVERAQEIIYELNLFYRNKLLKNYSVYLDSPMAIEATEIFKRNKDLYDEDAERLVESGDDPLEFPGLNLVRSTQDSKALANKLGSIILAGSGMCNGGRIVDHLRNNLSRPASHVIIVGYQVNGTLGRRLVDGESPVRIRGQEIEVKAKIHTLGGFSAHADERDLMYWLRGFGSTPLKTFMVHGDQAVAEAFAQNVKNETKLDTYSPSLHEEIDLV